MSYFYPTGQVDKVQGMYPSGMSPGMVSPAMASPAMASAYHTQAQLQSAQSGHSLAQPYGSALGGSSIGSTPGYPAATVYSPSPYAPAAAAMAHPGLPTYHQQLNPNSPAFSSNPYLGATSGMPSSQTTAYARAPAVQTSTSTYPGPTYTAASSMYGYATAAPLSSYPGMSVAGYAPAQIQSGVPSYHTMNGVPVAPSIPTYPGTSPYSRQLP